MKNDYDAANIIEGKIDEFTFKTHERFTKYYFKKDEYFEKQSTHHVLAFVKEGDTFIDVGAHHGYYSLIASKKLGPQGKIFAFEPVPENRDLLEKNLAQLEPKSYQVFSHAVSEKSGQAEFNIPWASDSASLYKHPLAETLKTIKVEVRALDELFPKEKIDFVKIDTEGNELQVLRGMKTVIKNNPDIKLLLEFNPLCLKEADTKPLELLNEISSLGFDIYIVDEENGATLKLVSNEQWEDYLVSVNYRNLLCVPKGIPSLLLFAHNDALAGAEIATVELAAQLQSRGCVVAVSIPGDGLLNVLCQQLNVSTTRHRSDWWLNQKNIAPTATQLELEKIMQHYNYDTVLASTIANPTIALCAKRMQKKLVWYIHEDITQFDYPYPIDNIVHYIDSLTDTVLLSSSFLKSRLEKKWPSFQKAKILYPFPQAKAYKKLPASDKPSLIMIGSIEENKNQLDALKALSMVHKEGFKPSFLFVGKGEKKYKAELEDFIANNNLKDQVKFAGELPDPEQFLSETAILLVCSYHESFGRTIVEAMRAGSLVITSNNGGSQDLVTNGKNALVYEPGDSKGLAALLQQALSEDQGQVVAGARTRYAELEKEYHKQLNTFQKILEDLSKEDRDLVQDTFNKNYMKEIEGDVDIDKKLLEEQRQLNQELKTAYAEMAEEYKELIKTHQALINSRAWRYSVKARKLIHPLK